MLCDHIMEGDDKDICLDFNLQPCRAGEVLSGLIGANILHRNTNQRHTNIRNIPQRHTSRRNTNQRNTHPSITHQKITNSRRSLQNYNRHIQIPKNIRIIRIKTAHQGSVSCTHQGTTKVMKAVLQAASMLPNTRARDQ